MWVAEGNIIKTEDGDVVAIVARGFLPSHIVELHNWWIDNRADIQNWKQEVEKLLNR